jgi:hypothetical protein
MTMSPKGDWWYTDQPKPHMREMKPLDAGPVRKRYPPDFQIVVGTERRRRLRLYLWRAIAGFGLGYIVTDFVWWLWA